MNTGYDNSNTRKYIDVLKLSLEIGPMCEPLPTICAFSGCDYTSHFMWKTKVKMYKKVEPSVVYHDLFLKFGEHPEVTDDLLEGTQKFLCDMYGKPRLFHLNDVRYTLFRDKNCSAKLSHKLAKLKGSDSSTLPPPTSVLLQKSNEQTMCL